VLSECMANFPRIVRVLGKRYECQRSFHHELTLLPWSYLNVINV
jgi:hypothetical protein